MPIMTPEETEGLIKGYTADIENSNPGLFRRFPLNQYVRYLERYPGNAHYNDVSTEVNHYCQEIIQYSSSRTLETYHKLLLLHLISESEEKLNRKRITSEIKTLFQMNFSRIFSRLASADGEPTGFYRYPNDKFCKDLSLCSLRLIPLGVVKVCPGGISKRFFFRNGLRQFIRGLGLVFFLSKGFQPFYQMHADAHDPDAMADFNPKGWTKMYRRMAELLKLNPHIKGMLGTTWFFDPKLSEISPRLAYLLNMVRENGGELFYLGPNDHSTRDALFRSPTRRRLYKEGKYLPKSHMLVWPRTKLIRWADRTANVAEGSLSI
jgi:hypothetical protein